MNEFIIYFEKKAMTSTNTQKNQGKTHRVHVTAQKDVITFPIILNGD